MQIVRKGRTLKENHKTKTQEIYKFYISKLPTNHINLTRSDSQAIDDLLLMGTQMEIRTILDIFLSSQSSLILRYSTSEYFSILNTPIVLLVFYLFVYNGEITTYMIQYAPSFFTSVNGNEIELLEVTKIFFSHSSISHCSKTML